MNDFLLNLGPFNDCIDVLGNGCAAKYGPLDGGEVFCFSKKGDTLRIGVLTGPDEITVEMLTLGLATDHNAPKSRKKLTRAVELKVLNMIYALASKCEIELKLSNVAIPIKSVNFEFDRRRRLCLVAVLGVAIFENSMTRIFV